MGRVLQIRVLAKTHNPDEVAKAWPRLFALAWPEDSPHAATLSATVKGVLELPQALDDQSRFAGWPKDQEHSLAPGIAKVLSLAKSLEAALADWNPSRANALSVELEDALDALEAQAPKPE